MASGFENIDLTCPASDYALVIFHDTPETYTPGCNIVCTYTITSALEPDPRDWVGIYKVGWRSARDYTCFDWSKVPAGYKKGEDVECMQITFNASHLPKDDGEFYQFCYVTSAGHVRGASTPFQFRRRGCEEYVEVVDDEDEDILVIKTKTAMLEDDLIKAEKAKKEHTKTIEYLEKEKELLLEKLLESERSVKTMKEDKTQADKTHETTQQKLVTKEAETSELQLFLVTLREKVNILNQELESCSQRLNDSDAYIKSLQEKIKMLINDKDSLTGQKKALEEEKHMLQSHFTSSEGQVKGYLVEMEELRQLECMKGAECQKLTNVIAEREERVSDLQERLDQAIQEAGSNKMYILELEGQLKNVEDKLEASVQSKGLLEDELSTLTQMIEKLSKDVENSKSEAHAYKQQLSTCNEVITVSNVKVTDLEQQLQDKTEEQCEMKAEMVRLRQMQTDIVEKEKAEEEGSLYALKVAYQNLSQRYEKTKAGKEEAIRCMEEAMTKLRRVEKEKTEVESDLTNRLKLGQEEYQKRVVELRHLQSELRRTQKLAQRSMKVEKEAVQKADSVTKEGECQTEELSVAESLELTEVIVKGSEAVVKEAGMKEEVTMEMGSLGGDEASLLQLSPGELIDQLQQMTEELEKRQTKKNKYKKMYQDEKEKRAMMQSHYFSELRKKDDEVKRLEQQLQDMKDDYSQRIMSLQSVINDKEEQLRRLRPQVPPVPMYPPQVQVPYPAHPQFIPMPGYYPPQGTPPPHMMPPSPLCTPLIPCPPIPARTRDLPPRRDPPPPPSPTQHPQTDSAPVTAPVMIPQNDAREQFDPLTPVGSAGGDPLLPPLTPGSSTLPPPLNPVRLPEALVAEVNALNSNLTTDVKEMHINMEETEEDEERYHDAEEEPEGNIPTRAEPSAPSISTDHSPVQPSLRTCPVCQMLFPDHVIEADIITHVETHMDKVCPVCSKTFDDTVPQDQYETHVQEHFAE